MERLGQGGMSQVWRGYDELLDRDVAVKMLTPRFVGDQTVGRRLRVEAQAVSRLSHPHITAVYDYGEAIYTNGARVPYVVMELVDGEPLSARLRGKGLHWADAVTICAQVAAALATAHAQGIVHRDVTPANVMLTSAGAKVVDFGISALTGERDAGPDGSLFGTPAYLAPERLDGGPVEPATDVYALGLLLYKSLAGRLPWPAMNTTQILRAHRLAEPAPLPGSIAAKLPPGIVELCRRCLAKRPQDRPACDEVAQALAAAVDLAVPLPEEELVVASPSTARLEETTLSWPADSDGPPDSDGPLADDGPPDAGGPPDADVASSADGPPDSDGSARAGSEGERAGEAGGKVHRRDATIVLVALVLLTVAAWMGARSPDGNSPGETAQVAAVSAGGGGQRCRVDYRVREDWGSGFRAEVAVTNQGSVSLRNWELAFAFAGDQRLSAARPATWRQSGSSVVARPAAPASRLDPGKHAEIDLVGEYKQANSPPRSFDLDGTPCQTVVAAAGNP